MADETLSTALTAGAVARRLGVAVTTLRTWHQRYGLGPSSHAPGQHRRYTAEDLDRLQVMRRLTVQGVPPAEAAAWARRPASLSPGTTGSAVPSSGMVGPSSGVVGSSSGVVGPSALAVADAGVCGRHGGGPVIPLGRGALPEARGVARAAMQLDAPAMRDILQASIGSRGVVATWNEVAVPVLTGIGERYEATLRYIEVEHLISRTLTEVLGAVPRPASGLPPRVLLAAADEEQHTLPLEALAAALAEAGVPTRLLGARVPSRALVDAVDRTGPEVVVLWSQTPATGDPAQLARLAALPRPPMLTAAGGPGWPHELPPGTTRLTTLTGAVELLSPAAR